MRILWVKAGKLLPIDSGGKIRSYNILRFLARSHEVTFLSYYGGSRDPDYEVAIRQELSGTQVMHTGVADETALQQAFAYLRRFPKAAPFAVSKFTDAKVRSAVVAHLSSGRFDVAVCDFLGLTELPE